ncbi:hypothetical protein VKT23_007655 [Stygiomarasmius scandens]|uniref:Terpene synthase n=1 Tax=Marasmiellus scandens TaxID=2682957 RepID=A0ABR1JMZ2_9AGAR
MPITISKPQQFVVPDLFASCNIEGAKNPYCQKAGEESTAWLIGHGILTDNKRATVVSGLNELLVARAYPFAGYEQLRTCCDFVNLLFAVDELSDEQSSKDARVTLEKFLNALKDPNNQDSSPLATMTKEYRARYFKLAGPQTSRRFLEHCEKYVECVFKEAELRERNQVLDLEAFIPLRRENSAVRLCFDHFEYALGLNLPQEVFDDPVFLEAYWAGIDLVCWSNASPHDIYSYNMEQAKGLDGNNVVTVLMKTYDFDLQTACDYAGFYFKKLMAQLDMAKVRLPSWGPVVDAQVAQYVEAIGYWVRGNLDWSFESNRYFGPCHNEIKSTRVVTLLPLESGAQECDSGDED